jgi:molybdate transport system substrate-binding protein
MRAPSWLIVAASILFLLSYRSAVYAAEIRVIATPSVSGIFEQLVPGFEKATGNKLVVQYGLVAAQKQRIEAGDFDLAITPSEVLDAEIAQGKIDAHSRADIAQTGLAVGFRTGAQKPAIGTVASFRQAMLKAHSVAYITTEASGQHVRQDFAALRIVDAMNAKTIAKTSVGDVWKAVASGEVELGFGFMPNVLTTLGVQTAGSFPAKLQFYTGVAAGVGSKAQQADAAKSFIKYLLNARTTPVFKAKGFERVKPKRTQVSAAQR